MTEPQFVPVDLTMLQDEGVLMAANERFFWPFGLALTWTHRPGHGGEASELHVREWQGLDGHIESVGLEPNDDVAAERRARFAAWSDARIDALPAAERARAYDVARQPLTPEVAP